MMEYTERQFYVPGDLVVCNKLPDAPTMYVLRKKELTMKNGNDSIKTLQGIVCRYLDK